MLILKRKCLVRAGRVCCGESGTPSTIIYTRWSSRRYELGCDAPVNQSYGCLVAAKNWEQRQIMSDLLDASFKSGAPGPYLNIKTVLPMYGDSHLKDGRETILFSIWESLYWQDDIHDDVNKWKDFPRYWPFVRGIHRSTVNSPHKCQWRGTLMFSLICVWINGWVNSSAAGDLKRYRAHYDVTVMFIFRQPPESQKHLSPPTAVAGVLTMTHLSKTSWKWHRSQQQVDSGQNRFSRLLTPGTEV